jgi:hypothetical protein
LAEDGVSFQNPHVDAGFRLLLEASRSAVECRVDWWEFAVAISELEAAGLSHGHLRWLVRHGYAEHGCERTTTRSKKRAFDRSVNLAFTPRTCFALTALGLTFVGSIVDEHAKVRLLTAPSAIEVRQANAPPSWLQERRELWWGGYLVKRFRTPAGNQEALLTVFQEEGWPPRIDDPLPPIANRDAKVRLHDTIKALNRCQAHAVLRFHGDGTGQAVFWKVVVKF